MKALRADWILTMDDDLKFIKNGAIVFDSKIIAVGTFDDIFKNFSNLDFKDCGINSVIMPALINPHVHLEFSKNKTALHYGSFISWLQSVMEKREMLLSDDGLENVIESLFLEMLKNGVASIGAISSLGKDFMPCVGSKQKVVYFNEIIGTNPDKFEIIWHDFNARLHRSERFASSSFIPAVSVHSAYSIHPTTLSHTLNLAKKSDFIVSTHFLESQSEFNWLSKSTGEFKVFFGQNFGLQDSFYTPMDFIANFEGIKSIFTHCTYATDEELQIISDINGNITHCPISNRLLGGKYFNVERAKNFGIDYSIGTDGLSSNFSLNPMCEIRHALFAYSDLNLRLFSYDLLKSITKNAADALRLNTGALKTGLSADIITFCLPGEIDHEDDLSTQIILHSNEVDHIYIDGELC